MIHFAVWQCDDFCCEEKSFSRRWWNVSRIVDGINRGYDSYSTWQQAMEAAA